MHDATDAIAPAEPGAPRIERNQGWIRVDLGGGRGHADFHDRWLRHHADEDRHPQTGERTLDSGLLPDDLHLVDARIEGEELVATWSSGRRETRHALAWLDAHAYARGRRAPPRPPSVAEPFTLDRGARALGELVGEVLARLETLGAAIVRRPRDHGVPPEDETELLLEAFEQRGLAVVPTHFGRIEDLRTDNTTNANTDQLGYTSAAVEPHTDQPFLERPPRYQILQCIRRASRGGDNALVDAEALEAFLRAEDARTAELLATVPVRFHRKQKAFERLVVSPIFSRPGGRFLVRASYFTMAPFDRPFEEMAEWYRAYDRFGRAIRDAQNQIRVTLEPGDWLVYDNHRMLHARTAFEGARWMRGIYLDARSPA